MRRLVVAAVAATLTCTGCAVVQRVSIAPGGAPDGPSRDLSLSADARYVAFTSSASNLVADDTNGVDDVFVRDQTTGSISRVSVASDGAEATGPSRAAAISGDGRYVAFASDAALVAADQDQLTDVYRHDRATGSTVLVSASPPAPPSSSLTGLARPELPTAPLPAPAPGSTAPERIAALTARAGRSGTVRLLATLATSFVPEGQLTATGRSTQRHDLATARATFEQQVRPFAVRILASPRTIPVVVVEADAVGVAAVARAAAFVVEDVPLPPTLAETGPRVGAPLAQAAGITGEGTAVAILDTGVDAAHPFLGGRVVEEACYSGNSSCPAGGFEQTGAGSAAPCTYAAKGCRHGTHVAGIAAGGDASDGVAPDGVAPGASILAIQVFSEFTGPICASQGEDPCTLSYTSDQILGLERVYELAGTYPVAAVNLSLGAFPQTSPCDWHPAKAVIDNLRAIGIATVVAAGNDGSSTSISEPACISSAISVGATTDADGVASFSNSAAFLSLLAPGTSVTSSVPGGGTAVLSGTSMATPQVAGAWALLKQDHPSATVPGALATLRATGVPITDARNGVTTTRLCVSGALGLAACRTGASGAPSISADGRHVAFESSDPNLVPDDGNDVSDVYVRDLALGTTTRVSVSTSGAEGHGPSTHAAISGDGTRVAFDSEAADLSPGDTNDAPDVFLRDLLAATTERVSVATDGGQAGGASTEAALSADGASVAFTSSAPDLVAGDSNDTTDVFVRDLGAGQTIRASVSSAGDQLSAPSAGPVLSGDGALVAFASTASTLDGPGGGLTHVYVRHRPSGLTRRASTDFWLAPADAPSRSPRLSADGRAVGFVSAAGNLDAPLAPDGLLDVFVRASLPPEVDGFTPTAAIPGATALAFTVSGRGFLPGARVDAGPGTTVQVLSVSPTQVVGTLDVASDAAPGARTISVTNLGGPGFAVGLCPDCLVVTQP